MDTYERHGVAFAKAVETFTKPYKKGYVVGMKMDCSMGTPRMDISQSI